MICQEDPSRFPWQCATERMARIHCKFLAVNITGPWWADVGKDAVGKGVPKNILICIFTEYYLIINNNNGFFLLTHSHNLMSDIMISQSSYV